MRPQVRVRKMRPRGQHHGRSTDGIRQHYYDPDIRTARNLVIEAYGIDNDWSRAEVAGQPKVIRIHEKTRPQAWQVSGGG